MNGVGASLIALAALLWGVTGGVAGVLVADRWDPFVVAFHRGAIGWVFVLVWLAIRPCHSGMGNVRLWLWSALAGLGVAGNFAFYFLSIAQGSVAVAVTLMYCAPVFVLLVSFALGLERPTPPKWIAIAAVVIGIVLLTGLHETGARAVTPLAIGAGLLSGLCYTLFIFGFRYAAPHGTPPAILTIAFAVFVVALVGPSDGDQIVAALRGDHWPLFAALGVFGAGVSFVLYVVGLRRTTPTVASIVATVEPVTAALFGVVVLDQGLSGTQIAGMVLILGTVAAIGTGSSVRPVSFGQEAGR